MKHLLHHYLFPRSSNNHRSKVLHHDALLLVVAFLFASFVFIQGMHREYPAVLGDAASVSIDDLLKFTNMQRQINGLAPLKMNDELSHAAELKAHDMFAKDYWAHVSPDGTTPWVFIKDSGYSYLYAGENLARGYDTSAAVVDAWMHSPSHRDNLLSPHYTDIGFAVQSGTLVGYNTILVVQEFGSPYSAGETAVSGQTASPPSNTSPPKEAPMADIKGGTIVPVSEGAVASVQSKPLVDMTSFKKTFAMAFLVFFIAVLAIDAIIVERKQIARIFSHNVDHMLFLLFILAAGILIGRGVVL